jgi:hypothetical protein
MYRALDIWNTGWHGGTIDQAGDKNDLRFVVKWKKGEG